MLSTGMDAEENDEFWYQLRRVGPTASFPKVRDVMKLYPGVTKFGRAASNHYYLDSVTLPNFISRHHSEIHGIRNEDGQIKFVLYDKGLNGTFINDIKMQSSCVLNEGDKITFGHTNGYKLSPGQFSRQPNSEFQFIFEKIQRVKKERVIKNDVKREQESDTSSDTEKRICTRDVEMDMNTIKEGWSKNNSKSEWNSDRKPSSHLKAIENLSQDNDSCSSSSSSSSSSSASSGSSSSSSSSSSSGKSSSKSPNQNTTEHTTESAFSLSHNNENSTLPMSVADSENEEEESDGNGEDNISEQSSHSKSKVNHTDESDQSENSDSNSVENSDSENDASNSEESNNSDSDDSDRNNKDDDHDDDNDDDRVYDDKKSESSDKHEEESEEADQSSNPVPVARKRPAPPKNARAKRTKLTVPSRRSRVQNRKNLRGRNNSSNFNDNDDLPSLNGENNHNALLNEDRGDEQRDPYLFASEESSDDETNVRLKAIIHSIGKIESRPGKGKRKQKKTIKMKNQKRKPPPLPPPPPPSKALGRKRKAPTAVSTTGKNKKAKPAPVKGMRGRKRKTKHYSDEDDLEEGVEWYEEETCDADDCKKPSDKTVAWVQCDFCDKWFHTQCVNCKYEHVNDPDIKFNCGCS